MQGAQDTESDPATDQDPLIHPSDTLTLPSLLHYWGALVDAKIQDDPCRLQVGKDTVAPIIRQLLFMAHADDPDHVGVPPYVAALTVYLMQVRAWRTSIASLIDVPYPRTWRSFREPGAIRLVQPAEPAPYLHVCVCVCACVQARQAKEGKPLLHALSREEIQAALAAVSSETPSLSEAMMKGFAAKGPTKAKGRSKAKGFK